MKRHLLAAALVAVAAPLFAQGMPKTPPGQPNPALVTAGTYNVDPGHTQVLWQVNHMGFSMFDGQFGGVTGTMQLDPAQPAAGKLSITIPMSGLTTTVLALDKHLTSPDFFDAAKYPTATFTSTSVQVNGMTARITGNLMLHGATRPVTLDARFVGAGPGMMGAHATNVGFEATTMIKRSDFGITSFVPLVSDEVQLHINAAFAKAS